MKTSLPALLAFFSFSAFAIVNPPSMHGTMEVLLQWAIKLVIVAVIFGGLLYLVRKAPMIPAELKVWIEYILWAILIIVCLYFLISLL